MPPLADMRFVLSDLLELDALTKLEPFGHADTETVMGLLEESGRFNREVIAPTNRVGAGSSSIPNTVAEDFPGSWGSPTRN